MEHSIAKYPVKSQDKVEQVSAQEMLSYALNITLNGFPKLKKSKLVLLKEKRAKELHLNALAITECIKYYLKKHKGIAFPSQERIKRECEIETWHAFKKALAYAIKKNMIYKTYIYREGFYERKRICCYFVSYLDAIYGLKHIISVTKGFCAVAKEIWQTRLNTKEVLVNVYNTILEAMARARYNARRKYQLRE